MNTSIPLFSDGVVFTPSTVNVETFEMSKSDGIGVQYMLEPVDETDCEVDWGEIELLELKFEHMLRSRLVS